MGRVDGSLMVDNKMPRGGGGGLVEGELTTAAQAKGRLVMYKTAGRLNPALSLYTTHCKVGGVASVENNPRYRFALTFAPAWSLDVLALGGLAGLGLVLFAVDLAHALT